MSEQQGEAWFHLKIEAQKALEELAKIEKATDAIKAKSGGPVAPVPLPVSQKPSGTSKAAPMKLPPMQTRQQKSGISGLPKIQTGAAQTAGHPSIGDAAKEERKAAREEIRDAAKAAKVALARRQETTQNLLQVLQGGGALGAARSLLPQKLLNVAGKAAGVGLVLKAAEQITSLLGGTIQAAGKGVGGITERITEGQSDALRAINEGIGAIFHQTIDRALAYAESLKLERDLGVTAGLAPGDSPVAANIDEAGSRRFAWRMNQMQAERTRERMEREALYRTTAELFGGGKK